MASKTSRPVGGASEVLGDEKRDLRETPEVLGDEKKLRGG
jgi:hypothetical protein